MLEEKCVRNILWVEGKSQLADSLTKRSAIHDLFLEVIRAARILDDVLR